MSEIVYQFEEENTRDYVLNPADFKMTTKYFLDGSVDFIARRIKHRMERTKEVIRGFGYMHPKTLTDEEIEQKRLENFERANRNAKQKIMYAVRQIGADHMLTLSTRENITDRETFFKFFSKFIRLVREKDLKNGVLVTRKDKRHFPYCAVPEYQERGAFHMHVAVVGKQDIPLLRACWYVALGGNISDTGEDTKGAINIQFRQKRFGSETDCFNAFKIVNYLTKYITKDFNHTDELGLHRYKVARQTPKPILLRQYLQACFSNGEQGFTDAAMETLNIAKFQGIKMGYGDFQIWNRGKDIFIVRGFLE